MEFLMTLKDGGVIDIGTDSDFKSGCPTCDFGREFLTFCRITLTKFTLCLITLDSNDVVFNTEDILKLFDTKISTETTEKEFVRIFITFCLSIEEDHNIAFRVDNSDVHEYELWKERSEFYHFKY